MGGVIFLSISAGIAFGILAFVLLKEEEEGRTTPGLRALQRAASVVFFLAVVSLFWASGCHP
jgi:hypothetical protein